jgi:hypothetical protein
MRWSCRARRPRTGPRSDTASCRAWSSWDYGSTRRATAPPVPRGRLPSAQTMRPCRSGSSPSTRSDRSPARRLRCSMAPADPGDAPGKPFGSLGRGRFDARAGGGSSAPSAGGASIPSIPEATASHGTARPQRAQLPPSGPPWAAPPLQAATPAVVPGTLPERPGGEAPEPVGRIPIATGPERDRGLRPSGAGVGPAGIRRERAGPEPCASRSRCRCHQRRRWPLPSGNRGDVLWRKLELAQGALKTRRILGIPFVWFGRLT